MFLSKALLITAVLAVVNGRIVNVPYHYLIDTSDIAQKDVVAEQPLEAVYPVYNLRIKRQLNGVVNTNPDGSANIFGKLPLAGNSDNTLSATGSLTGAIPGSSFGALGAGLSLDNVNGHGLSLSGKHIPDFGNQLTAAGKVNLLNTDRNNLIANAFVTRNMPTIPNAPSFNTYGAGLDYMFNNKLGASVGVAHMPTFKKTDVSAMANYNIFRDRTSSLDFNAGVTRSFSHFSPKSSWQPSAGFTFSKTF